MAHSARRRNKIDNNLAVVSDWELAEGVVSYNKMVAERVSEIVACRSNYYNRGNWRQTVVVTEVNYGTCKVIHKVRDVLQVAVMAVAMVVAQQ